MHRTVGLLVLAIAAHAGAQTTIDLGTQARNVDFTRAVSTRPVKTGNILPPVCTTGDLFFLEGRTAVIYACVATNTWTLQSNAMGAGAGWLAQTSTGVVTRSFTATSGLVLSNGDGQTGDPVLAADIAESTDAAAGTASGKLMTPERTRQSFEAWNPIPLQAGKAQALMTTNGAAAAWSWKLIIPAGGIQTLANSAASIRADRAFVRIEPASTFTLSSQPVIADGEDGEFLTIANVSVTNTVTLPDEAVVPGSNLRLGGRNLDLGPRQAVTLVFAVGTGDWVITQKGAGAASGTAVSGPVSSVDSQMTLFAGTGGDALKAFGGTGVLKASGGIPAVVSGNAQDCVRVDGSAGACVSDVSSYVTGPASSGAGQLAVYAGTTGKALNTSGLSGVLKASGGVPAVVSGNAQDCVRVDGSAGACGGGGALTITDYQWYATASNSNGSGGTATNGWTVPPASATINTNGTNAVMSFADSGTPAGVFPLLIPSNWAGGPVSIKMQFTPSSSGCGSGENIIWKVKSGAQDINEVANAYPVWGALKTVTHTLPSGAANRLQSVTFTDLDNSSWAAGRRASIWFERDSAADSGTCSVQLLGIELGLRRILQ